MPVSYIQKIRDFRGKNIESASPGGGGNHLLPKRKNSLLSKAKRPRTLNTTSRARSSGRQPQSLSERHSMAKPKRKRDKRGHFIKKSRTKKRRNPVKRKSARRAAPRKARKSPRRKARKSGVVRVKRALGRKRKSGRFVKRSKHRVAGHLRKVRGTRKKRRIASHLSYEAATPNPRRRRKRRAAREVEEVMPKRRRRRAKKASAPKRRRRRAAARENPVKRRRRRRVAKENPVKRRRAKRRSYARAANPVRRRRTKRRARSNPRKRCRTKSKRCVYVRPGKRRSKRRKASHRRTSRSHRLPASTQHEYPFGMENGGGYGLENPMSGGEMLLAGATATLGFVLTDILDRWLAVKELVGSPNATGGLDAATGTFTSKGATGPLSITGGAPVAVLSKPGIWRILAQAGAAAVPFTAAYYVKQPMGRAALQGVGVGALVHLGSQLLTHYVLLKVLSGAAQPAAGTAPSLMNQMNNWYGAELMADNAATLATTGTNGTLVNAVGLSGYPRNLGRTPVAYQVPRAVAAAPQGVGDCAPCNAGNAQAEAAAAAAAAWAAGQPNCGNTDPCNPAGDPCDPSVLPVPVVAPPPSGNVNGIPANFGAMVPAIHEMFQA